jgi:hypothetical protein
MATNLDEGSVGIKILAGLPDGNGLPAIAADLLDKPRPVFALVELRPYTETHRIETDSHTVTMRIAQVEPLEGAEADALRDQLDARREHRTGQTPIPGLEADGTEVPAGATGPDEWTDEELAAHAAEQEGGAVPPFSEPTPIGKAKRPPKA